MCIRTYYIRRLTFDHKASDPGEQARVTASGGWVSMNRVHGVLAVCMCVCECVYVRMCV